MDGAVKRVEQFLGKELNAIDAPNRICKVRKKCSKCNRGITGRVAVPIPQDQVYSSQLTVSIILTDQKYGDRRHFRSHGRTSKRDLQRADGRISHFLFPRLGMSQCINARYAGAHSRQRLRDVQEKTGFV